MRKEFADYLASISVPTAVVGRVDRIIALYADLMPATDPEKIFVSDQFDQEGNRSFRSLILFSDEYMLEAKSFVSEDIVDAVYLKTAVDYIEISLKEYEPGKATDASRLSVKGYISSEFDFDLRAAGENCNYLWIICKELLMPNCVKGPPATD